jgi:hypothetical protein
VDALHHGGTKNTEEVRNFKMLMFNVDCLSTGLAEKSILYVQILRDLRVLCGKTPGV